MKTVKIEVLVRVKDDSDAMFVRDGIIDYLHNMKGYPHWVEMPKQVNANAILVGVQDTFKKPKLVPRINKCPNCNVKPLIDVSYEAYKYMLVHNEPTCSFRFQSHQNEYGALLHDWKDFLKRKDEENTPC